MVSVVGRGRFQSLLVGQVTITSYICTSNRRKHKLPDRHAHHTALKKAGKTATIHMIEKIYADRQETHKQTPANPALLAATPQAKPRRSPSRGPRLWAAPRCTSASTAPSAPAPCPPSLGASGAWPSSCRNPLQLRLRHRHRPCSPFFCPCWRPRRARRRERCRPPTSRVPAV